MTQEDINQFAAALAERYVQLDQGYMAADQRYQDTISTKSDLIENQLVYVQREQAYARWKLMHDVITLLPDEIRIVFHQEHIRITKGIE